MREQTISMIGFAVSAMLFLSACWFSLEIQSGIRSGVEKGLALTEDQHSGVITVPGAERGRAMIYGGSEVLFTLRDVEKGHFDIEVGSVRFPAGSNLKLQTSRSSIRLPSTVRPTGWEQMVLSRVFVSKK